MSSKRKFLYNVVNQLINESKLIWKPLQRLFHLSEDKWANVRVSVPFNNHKTTQSDYFRNEGTHQRLFVEGLKNFLEDVYALNEGEKYLVYEIYIKKMTKRINDFIEEHSEEKNSVNEIININRQIKRINYSDSFIEKIKNYIKRKYPQVIDIKKEREKWMSIRLKEFLHVYVDEDDGQPTDIVQHPLKRKIEEDINDNLLFGMDSIEIKVTNLNKDTKLRGHTSKGINESRKEIKKEQDDIERAVQYLNRIPNFDVSYDDIVKEIKRSTPTKITDEIWGDLQNTESNQIQFGDFNSVFNLSNKYNKSNPLKLKKKIEQNEYKYPIIVRFNDQYYLVSGNTRLCTAAAMGEYLDVIIADINKPFPVDEGKIYKKNNV